MNAAEELTETAADLFKAGDVNGALEVLVRSLAMAPNQPKALMYRGFILLREGQYADAVETYEQLAVLAPSADAYNGLGLAQHNLAYADKAKSNFEKAISLDPNHAEAHGNMAMALLSLDRNADALAAANQALMLAPWLAEAHCNRGLALHRLNKPSEALASFDAALAADSNLSLAWAERGDLLFQFGRYDEARSSFERALDHNEDLDETRRLLQHTRMRLCDWRNWEAEWRSLVAQIEQGRPGATPFSLMALPSTRAQQRKTAEMLAPLFNTEVSRAAFVPTPRAGKLRVGYFSADFHEHATSHLIARLIEVHNREDFEIIGFSFDHGFEDPMRKRLVSAFDQFIDIAAFSDAEAASLARDRNIDIAVDMKGVTQHSRPGIFISGAAPIQINFLGYPATMCVDFIHYLVADPILIPEAHRADYGEKIAYLPETYQPNDDMRPIADRACTRAELGLPRESFVFCSFNSYYKLTPPVFDIWMRLLAAVKRSVLWLPADLPSTMRTLKNEAVARGIDPARLIFAEYLSQDKHLARLRAADLSLDTFYCCAHTTASDALWAGLPHLTLLGETFAGRVAGSLLNAVGLPELITRTPEQYEQMALALARDPARLTALREKLAANRLTHPLFDTPRFARHIEAAYREMHRRFQAGLPPDHIFVEPLPAGQR